MVANIKCSQCVNGRVSYEEDGRMVEDACYHCGETGIVDEEIAFEDRMNGVAAVLANRYVAAEREAANNDPEGEGWAFRAAENMLSEYDYTKARTYDRMYQFAEELAKLSPALRTALVEALNPEPKVKPEPVVAPVTEPAPAAVDSDEIPF
jgi:hypothetical protein